MTTMQENKWIDKAGAGEYLFTRTYYGYTLKQAKAQFKIALEGEDK